jgi:hypothetical protein
MAWPLASSWFLSALAEDELRRGIRYIKQRSGREKPIGMGAEHAQKRQVSIRYCETALQMLHLVVAQFDFSHSHRGLAR